MNKEGKRRGCQFSIGWQRRASLRRYHERSKKVEFLLRTVTRLVKGPPRDTQPPKNNYHLLSIHYVLAIVPSLTHVILQKPSVVGIVIPILKWRHRQAQSQGAPVLLKGTAAPQLQFIIVLRQTPLLHPTVGVLFTKTCFFFESRLCWPTLQAKKNMPHTTCGLPM